MPHPKNTMLRGSTYYGVVQVDGRPLRKSLGTGDPVEAEKRVARWLREVSPRHFSNELTFAQVASSWIETYEKSYTAKTWKRYKTSMKMLKPFFGELLWSDINRQTILQYMEERRREVSIATINRDLAPLSNIIEHAIDKGWSEDNPLRKLSRRSRREKRTPFVIPSDEMIEAVFARMKSAFGDFCRFALLTGMRKDEIVALTWQTNINLDRGTVTTFKTKTHRPRVINLSAEAVAVLRKQPHRTGTVFLTRAGKPFNNASEGWRDVVKRAAKLWESTHGSTQPFIRFRFHDLRHLYAIRYLVKGGNLYDLQHQLGHSTIRQTEMYLEFLTPEEQLRSTHRSTHTSSVSEGLIRE